LWTREGAQTRQFINRNLGEFELDLRTQIATAFINTGTSPTPTKTKAWFFSLTNQDYASSFGYLTNNYVREYLWSIDVVSIALVFEWAADSDTRAEVPDLDSPEFEGIFDDDLG
jgi:hypothetical protein